MPRKPRVEYAGAIYHVMCRGNRREAIFRSGRDSEMFLDTLGESIGRCGWRVHAYVLMGNHYFEKNNLEEHAHRSIEKSEWGFDEFRTIKNIRI